MLRRGASAIVGTARSVVNRLFLAELVAATDNFSRVTWLGRPIWQNVLDLWTIQETIWELKPGLLVECGTYRGGSALFYANLFDLIGRGRVVTIDVSAPADLHHPRVEVVAGSSLADEVVARIGRFVAETEGAVMVILDSDHAERHVRAELERYAAFVTPGSFLLVQDGVIDVLPAFRSVRPGPLPAIDDFLARHPEFEVDAQRSRRFPVTHHPRGWLRRR